MDINAVIASEFSLDRSRVDRTVQLLDEGNTVPFIARYRKEATGSLDDQVLRALSERLIKLRSLDKRREEILRSLEALGITDEKVLSAIRGAATATQLEDLYRPFRPKRRTRASAAREKGLEGLAAALMAFPLSSPKTPEEIAAGYISPEKDVPDAESALQGARDIIAEMISDDADLRGSLREEIQRRGTVHTQAAKEEDSVYAMYYDRKEAVSSMPGHRVLAMDRGEKEGFLKVSLLCDDERILALISARYPGRGNARE